MKSSTQTPWQTGLFAPDSLHDRQSGRCFTAQMPSDDIYDLVWPVNKKSYTF